MKKLYTLVLTSIMTAAAFGQSQRLVLVEEFTQASCGPCASQNPAFNTLLANNTAKVVSLKYQTSWPGVDPMNAQNPSDAANRVTYYSISGVPHGKVDGVSIVNDCSYYTGAPACLSQSEIDAQYNVPSPFTLSLTHVMSVDYDSAYVTAVITASQSFTSNGTLRFRLAMVEKEINFITPPGTNGETDFYMVMRKMYPNGTGTSLSGTWTNAQTQTLNFAVSIPSYIYDLNEVAFVGFIQSDGNKAVQQAAYSAPVLVQNDAGVVSATGVPSLNCTGLFTPTVTITNTYGNTNLTSVDVYYQIDNGTPAFVTWTGNIAMNQNSTITLPQLTATDGSHTLSVWTANPNGSPDQYGANNLKTFAFTISLTPTVTPITEGFVAIPFPPNEWAVSNPDNSYSFTRWNSAGGFAQSTSCTKMDFFNSPNNQVDELYLPYADLSSSNTAASLTFNMAYAQFSNASNDRLEVKVSTDCGTTWTTVFNKAGTTLKTTNPVASAFNPSGSMWRNEIVDLSQFAGNNDVSIKFVATSNSGNNLFIDDINLTSTTGINETGNNVSFDVAPNPFSGNANIFIHLSSSAQVSFDVYNVVGEKVMTLNAGSLGVGENTLSLNADALAEGVYFVTLHVDKQTLTKKVVISR